MSAFRPTLCRASAAIGKGLATAHPALRYYPNFLSPAEQSLLLHHSLGFLSTPAHTSSKSRSRLRDWLRKNSEWKGRIAAGEELGFMEDAAYEFESGHFDGVIKGFRECLVRDFGPAARQGDLRNIMDRVYGLLPPYEDYPPPTEEQKDDSPPSHIQLHLLHLSSTGAIFPHVDNLTVSGPTVIGVSLGGARVAKFKRKISEEPVEEDERITKVLAEGPDEFEVLLEPGSAYVQNGILRTHFTHELPAKAMRNGVEVGGEQRLSLMLRDLYRPPA